MIPANILQRTLRIKHKDKLGTAFTIDVDNKQYLVTAKHVVNDILEHDQLEIFHDSKWKKCTVKIVGVCKDNIDITVLTTDFQLTSTHKLNPTSDKIIFGQDVYFLGFPHGLYTDAGAINYNFPIPFIKKAILSAGSFSSNNLNILLLDGHGNPGFSGGPVVFYKNNQKELNVAGVISVSLATDDKILKNSIETDFIYKHNSGIILAYGIIHAVEIIKSNPAGFKL